MNNDQKKSILRKYPERIPLSAGILPAAWMKYRDDLEEIVNRHPRVFGTHTGERDYDYLWSENYAAGG